MKNIGFKLKKVTWNSSIIMQKAFESNEIDRRVFGITRRLIKLIPTTQIMQMRTCRMCLTHSQNEHDTFLYSYRLIRCSNWTDLTHRSSWWWFFSCPNVFQVCRCFYVDMGNNDTQIIRQSIPLGYEFIGCL